jgi:hypothetical protein
MLDSIVMLIVGIFVGIVVLGLGLTAITVAFALIGHPS